jgi:uncharacterized protein YejL (UPF0352 family)
MLRVEKTDMPAQIFYPPLAPYFYNNLYSTKEELLLVTPYIKESVAEKIVKVLELSGASSDLSLTIITNVDTTNLLSGSSDISALEVLLSRIPRSTLIGIGNLHAKCYVFDGKKIIITSSNLTPRGLNRNLEMAVEIDDEQSASRIRAKLIDAYGSMGATLSLADVRKIRKDLEAFFEANADKIREREKLLSEFNLDITVHASKEVSLDSSEEVDPNIAKIIYGGSDRNVILDQHLNDRTYRTRGLSSKGRDEWDIMFDKLVVRMERVRERGYKTWPLSLGAHKPTELDIWCSNQRQDYKDLELVGEHLAKLHDIGFEFKDSKALWERGYEMLSAYRKRYPDQWPNIRDVYSNFELGEWVEAIRNARMTSKLKANYVEELDKLDFIWDVREAHWEPTIRLLKEYREVHPDRWPKKKEKFKGYDLYTWLKRLSQTKGMGLPPDHLQELESIGFPMSEYISAEEDRIWQQNYEVLIDYIKQYRSWPTTQSKEFLVRRTAVWLEKERRRMFAGHVPEDKQKLLSKLGVKPLVTAKFPLAKIEDAFAHAAAGRGVKTIITHNGA